MEILWERSECCVRDVVQRLKRPLAYTTVMTTLDRLYKKGLLNRHKPERAFLYAPQAFEGGMGTGSSRRHGCRFPGWAATFPRTAAFLPARCGGPSMMRRSLTSWKKNSLKTQRTFSEEPAMIFPYLLRLLCLCFAAFFLVHTVLSSIVWFGSRLALRLAEKMKPSSATSFSVRFADDSRGTEFIRRARPLRA